MGGVTSLQQRSQSVICHSAETGQHPPTHKARAKRLKFARLVKVAERNLSPVRITYSAGLVLGAKGRANFALCETLAEITRALEHISSAHYIGGFKMVPQIVYLLLLALGLGITMEQHGKPKTGKHNFWVSLIAAALSFAIVWWGGFFNVFFK